MKQPVRGNQGMWEGAAKDAAALENCERFLGFLKAPLDVWVDPIVKFVRKRSGEIEPSTCLAAVPTGQMEGHRHQR